MKYLIFLFIGFIALPSFAQIGADFEKRNKKRNSESPFGANRRDAIYSHSNSQYKPLGWHVDLGVTYMMGNNANDNREEYQLTPTGLPGYYLEGGMEHLMKKPRKIIHYFDWGLGVKHFGGQEKYELNDFKTRGSFNFGSAFLRGAAHNVIQLSKYNFIDQSIGFNLDYRIYGGADKQASGDYLSPLPSVNQSKLVAQLHYSIGYGFKLRDGLFVVPTFQVPVLTLLQFNDFNPSHNWFNSRYLPLIFTVKLAWLRPKTGCPKVFDNGESKQQSDQYQMQ